MIAQPSEQPAAETLAYALPALIYARFRITLRALGPARLPVYQGSMLRGAFGHALRWTVCSFGPEAPCAPCVLRRECPYPRIFETPIVEAPAAGFLDGVSSAPRPYVFEPGAEATSLAPGDSLPFDLLLFGGACELQRYALATIERMAGEGLGAAVGGRRGTFELARVQGVGPGGAVDLPFESGRGGAVIAGPSPAWPGSPLPTDPLPGDGRRVRLRFLTAARLLEKKRLVVPDRPRQLAFAMVRRVLDLATFHMPGAAVDWTFRPLLEHAGRLRVVESDLSFHDGERYSQRQQAHTPLGGFLGSIVLEGDLAPLAPLLRAAEVVHFGKGTVFGLGRVVIEAA
ncbi:MAG TPA: CRISPR system precrRNA processing endoribonuclease RAMP protein Cas6 [Thermoanaerobaculia bacterium]|nr:CRISPR system precrRNA processing endoribonuclease RAMP protein Cas6 [Thermoanaerobaculia bacterium]